MRLVRILGYTLLIFGALDIAHLSLALGLEGRAFAEQYIGSLLTPQQTWTHEEVEQLLRTGITDFTRQIAIPQLLIGAALMLCGGICLDVAGQRKRTEPNGVGSKN
jgi:hypothetical protein